MSACKTECNQADNMSRHIPRHAIHKLYIILDEIIENNILFERIYEIYDKDTITFNTHHEDGIISRTTMNVTQGN